MPPHRVSYRVPSQLPLSSRSRRWVPDSVRCVSLLSATIPVFPPPDPEEQRMKTNAGLASSLSRFAFVVIFAVCLPVLHAQTPSPVYDRFMKVVPPADWVEKRPWELGDDRSLPFYSQPSEAVALIFGSNRPTYRTGFLEHLGQGDELKHRLEIELHAWPAEASRFYTMVSGGFAISKESNTVT